MLESRLSDRDFIWIAGPCAVESEEQIDDIAIALSGAGVRLVRGGAYKPRTDPRDFQGLGPAGIEILSAAAGRHGLATVSEVLTEDQLEQGYEEIDVVQIGSRNMTCYGLLKAVGRMTARDQKPVLLKRGMCSTIPELIHASEYIQMEGNPCVMLCLRGIRTFEQIDSTMRFTPDLASITELNRLGRHTVIFDPSHSSGRASDVPALVEAAIALEAGGVMIEVHQNPSRARCDAAQAISLAAMSGIVERHLNLGNGFRRCGDRASVVEHLRQLIVGGVRP